MARRHLAPALVLGIALTLAAQSAWAGPRSQEEYGSASQLIIQLWHSFSTSWTAVGCWVDPGGACKSAQAPSPETDTGCWLDPGGHCGAAQAPAAPPETDVGCWIDPHGACHSGG